MKKMYLLILIIVVIIIAVGIFCLPEKFLSKNTKKSGDGQMTGYISISMEKAKEIFESDNEKSDYIILDVRRPEEFSEGHIPGAINVANEDISNEQPKELPDKEQEIYVYCRSGRRSKEAAGKLAGMGYTNVIEFGGIIDWTGEVER